MKEPTHVIVSYDSNRYGINDGFEDKLCKLAKKFGGEEYGTGCSLFGRNMDRDVDLGFKTEKGAKRYARMLQKNYRKHLLVQVETPEED